MIKISYNYIIFNICIVKYNLLFLLLILFDITINFKIFKIKFKIIFKNYYIKYIAIIDYCILIYSVKFFMNVYNKLHVQLN
jgi:hypothetical protein